MKKVYFILQSPFLSICHIPIKWEIWTIRPKHAIALVVLNPQTMPYTSHKTMTKEKKKS